MGAAGERGVDHLIGFLREGLERTMALTGSRRIDEIDRDLVEWR
ncbi:MAG: alpha-hydroxy-acid oxidizing protein [Ilumatobacteraceae bacterium]|jgi:L-lactate dehydrogenase (cytochrome)